VTCPAPGEAGGDRVSGDPAWSELPGDVRGLCLHRRLGRAVGTGAAWGGDRTERDDPCVRREPRRQRGCDQHGGQQVGVQVGAPVRGQFGQVTVGGRVRSNPVFPRARLARVPQITPSTMPPRPLPASPTPPAHPPQPTGPPRHTRLCAPTDWRGEGALAPIYWQCRVVKVRWLVSSGLGCAGGCGVVADMATEVR
jgi:hypothetical protein